MALYSPGPIPTGNDIGQLQRFLREEFEKIAQAQREIAEAVGLEDQGQQTRWASTNQETGQ